MMVVPVTVGPIRVSRVPSLYSCADTTNKKISEAVTAEFSSKVQVKVTLEPRMRRELRLLLIIVIEDGVGTSHKNLILLSV